MLRELTPAQLREHAPQACQASGWAPAVVELRAGGAAITPSRRDELLAQVAAGSYVELEIDLLAFEQETGKRNRSFVRFREGALVAFGRSGKDTPLLRDHEQGDLLARAGTVISSSTTKVAEGHYQIRQVAKVTAPWAVEALLRGTLDRFSIGWNPTGEVLCSACNKAIFSRCYHFPGDRLSEQTDENGGKRMVRDRAGSVVVEWIYTEADLVETSAVSVPAVPTAHIEGIRAALAALGPVGDELFGADDAPKKDTMLKSKLIALLALAATAGEDEVLTAVESQRERLRLTEGQRDELAKKTAELAARQAAQDAASAKQAEESFIEGAVRARKLAPGSKLESDLRRYFALDQKGARELLDGMPETTLVGAPRQSGGPDPTPHAGDVLAQVDAGLKQVGATPEGVRKVLAALGSKPKKTLTTFGPRALGLATPDMEE